MKSWATPLSFFHLLRGIFSHNVTSHSQLQNPVFHLSPLFFFLKKFSLGKAPNWKKKNNPNKYFNVSAKILLPIARIRKINEFCWFLNHFSWTSHAKKNILIYVEFGESFRNLAESIYPSKVPFKQTKVWPIICHRPVALVQQNLLDFFNCTQILPIFQLYWVCSWVLGLEHLRSSST